MYRVFEACPTQPPMKFSKQIPPPYEMCHKLFGVNWSDGLIITYGDTIYCASDIPDELIAHESVHIVQQERMGKDAWWEKYFVDPKFRLEQETAAYIAQVKFLKENYDRPYRRMRVKKICDDMARMYGGMCTREQAFTILKDA